MTTLAQDKARTYGAESKIGGSAPVIASDIIYEGAAVGESASTGTARPLAGGDNFMGFAFRKADNAAGAAGAVCVELVDPNADPLGDDTERSNSDNQSVPPGKTKVLLDATGPGVITHLWLTFLGPEPQNWAQQGSANHQEMLLRIYWDGNPRPGVEAPVGDFFANCFGRRSEVISTPLIVEDADSYNCFWRMPFRKSARIEIVNQSEKPISLLYYNIDWIKKDKLPKDTPYFYAQYRQEYPAQHGKDYVVLETTGKGHYVGTVLAVRTRSPAQDVVALVGHKRTAVSAGPQHGRRAQLAKPLGERLPGELDHLHRQRQVRLVTENGVGWVG